MTTTPEGLAAIEAWRARMTGNGTAANAFEKQAAYNRATIQQVQSEPWRGEKDGGPVTNYLRGLADHHRALAKKVPPVMG